MEKLCSLSLTPTRPPEHAYTGLVESRKKLRLLSGIMSIISISRESEEKANKNSCFALQSSSSSLPFDFHSSFNLLKSISSTLKAKFFTLPQRIDDEQLIDLIWRLIRLRGLSFSFRALFNRQQRRRQHFEAIMLRALGIH